MERSITAEADGNIWQVFGHISIRQFRPTSPGSHEYLCRTLWQYIQQLMRYFSSEPKWQTNGLLPSPEKRPAVSLKTDKTVCAVISV